MYKALIVDDEIAAREMIRFLVDWDKIGFEEPVQAGSGNQGLKLFQEQKFDIVFTDIEMPGMDGLQMIKQIKEQVPEQEIVVISCHESFAYAKRALRMGVQEYLIKDLMNEEDLYTILLEHTVKQKKLQLQGDKKQKESYNTIVLKLISGEVLAEQDKKVLEESLERNGKKHHYCIAIARVDERQKLEQGTNYKLLCNMKRFYEKLSDQNMFVLQLDSKSVMILVKQEPCPGTAETMNRIMEYMNHIRAEALSCGLCSITIGVSELKLKDSAKQIEILYRQARRACDMKVFRGNNRTIFYSSLVQSNLGIQGEELDGCLKKISEAIQNKDYIYRELLKKIYRPNFYGGFLENNYLCYVNWYIWNVLFYIRRKNKGKEEPSINILEQGAEKINNLESARDMEQFFDELIQNYFMTGEDAKGNDNIVVQAKSYIEKEIMKDISLVDVAEHLHVHKGYLCRIFKEQIGINLVTYIQDKKMEEAKRLLRETMLKTYEIADLLGYQSPQYFSIVFKKNVNMSPNDYRKQEKHE